MGYSLIVWVGVCCPTFETLTPCVTKSRFFIPISDQVKVTVHLEQCFQFSVCNFVNMHWTATTYTYVNGKLRNEIIFRNDGKKFV